MWRKTLTILVLIAVAILTVGSWASAQVIVQNDNRDDYYDDDDSNYDSNYDSEYIERDYDYDRNGRGGSIRIDRYLDADVWTNRSDNEFYSGDNIRINYRVNRDAYIAIYSIDTRGRVHLLYPSQPGDNPWRRGGVTYSLPGPGDDFDLVVSGPEGTENIAIIASRERFPIPSWYNGSGIICRDQDRDEFLSYLHRRHFMRYDGQRFAFDREVLYVNEWERDYFRPVYYPSYPSWSVVGNLYVDYPWGGTIYIDGIYWGVAPLYIPAVLVGWRTITVYDPWGYCWERNIHISRYNTVVLNHTIIRTSNSTVSKYKEVRQVGYRDPVQHGYPKYQEIAKKSGHIASAPVAKSRGGVVQQRPDYDGANYVAPKKKFVRGSGQLVKTERGYETPSVGGEVEKRSRTERRSVRSYQDEGTLDRFQPDGNGTDQAERRGRRSSGEVRSRTEPGQADRGGYDPSSEYYQRKGGKVERSQPNTSSGDQKVEKGKRENPLSQRARETYERSKKAEEASKEQVQQRQSDNKGGNRGGEVKQRSGNSSDRGGARPAAPSNNSKGNSGNSGGKGKGRN